MKFALTIVLCALSIIVRATNYYISSSGDDSNNGLSESAPWKSINKVNSAFSNSKPGDSFLFRRGDTFYGTIKLTKSGVAGSPITFGAYGTGEKPIITGFTTITGWTSNGNGIYYKVISPESAPNMVTIDGVNTSMGRYPDATWLSIDAHVTNVSITDASLQGDVAINWTGAELVMRKSEFIIDRHTITNHLDHTLSYSSSVGEENTSVLSSDGWGYFIQNHIKTLTSLGEWYYSGGKFYMYFGTTNPSTKTVNVSTIDKLIDFNAESYVTVQNISFEGANKYANHISSAVHITIDNCSFNFSGRTAIYAVATSPYAPRYYNIVNNTISNSNNNAIYLEGNDNLLISNNTILNTGVNVGMGWNSMPAYGAIFVASSKIEYSTTSSAIIQHNNIANTGYNAIEIEGNNITVQNNFINNFCFNKSDGGAIYTAYGYTNRLITKNIILNCSGAPGGAKSNTYAYGIYLDASSTDVKITYNSVANVISSGLYISSADFITIENNTVFNCGHLANIMEAAQIVLVHFGAPYDSNDLHDITIRHNKLIAKSLDQYCFAHQSIHNNIGNFGTLDYNYYARPLNNTNLFLNYGTSGVVLYHTLSEWKTFLGQDAHSFTSDAITTDTTGFFRFAYNSSLKDSTITLTVPMVDVTGTKYTKEAVIPPYSSLVLMVDFNHIQPVVPTYVSSVIQNSNPSVLEMNYTGNLANGIPATSSFEVYVNGASRTVSHVGISGTKVQLTLSSAVISGDLVTIAYTRPSLNPLQSPAGGLAESISAKPVTNNCISPVPVLISSIVEDATPSILEMTYNLSLANILPAVTSFTVAVNSITRTVSSVSVSTTKVLLSLLSPVVSGDVVSVTYTKPAGNPLQTPAGGQAASISSQTVTNKVTAPIPVYVSSSVENAAPSKLVITYNQALAYIVPAASAFTVLINSGARAVSSVAISGTSVQLTLANALNFGDVITVAYAKPASNPIQTSLGGQAAAFTAQSVANKVNAIPAPAFTGAVVENSAPTVIELYYNLALANIVPAFTSFTVKINSVIKNVIAVTISGSKVLLTLSDGILSEDNVTITYTKPSANPLQTTSGGIAATFITQQATNKIAANGPVYVSSVIENAVPNTIEVTYNDVLNPSAPGVSAFLVLVNGTNRPITSVTIIGKKVLLLLESPVIKGDIVTVSYTKPAGNPLQKATGDLAVSIGPQPVTNNCQDLTGIEIRKVTISIYPNPASEFINFSCRESSSESHIIKIFDFSGKLCLETRIDPFVDNIRIPINLRSGAYIVHVILGSLTIFTHKLLVNK
jgi:uncharacterized repeat protein (TIGR02059 family)